MANLLDSSASTTTSSTAPQYYTDYVSGLAANATNAANSAKFAGATDLQNNAFNNVTSAGGAFQPTLDAAGNTLNAATTANSPLSAANPYLAQATSNLGADASALMNPYNTNVVTRLVMLVNATSSRTWHPARWLVQLDRDSLDQSAALKCWVRP